MPMSIAALFTIAKTWKQPKCASRDEWIKKMWCIYTMEYYSSIKRNKIESFDVDVDEPRVSYRMKLLLLLLSHFSRV